MRGGVVRKRQILGPIEINRKPWTDFSPLTDFKIGCEKNKTPTRDWMIRGIFIGAGVDSTTNAAAGGKIIFQ